MTAGGSPTSFYVSRIARIWPPHVACFVLLFSLVRNVPERARADRLSSPWRISSLSRPGCPKKRLLQLQRRQLDPVGGDIFLRPVSSPGFTNSRRPGRGNSAERPSYAYYSVAGRRIPHLGTYPNLAALVGVELPQNFAASRVCPGGVTATWLPESFREARLRGGDPQNWPLMPAPVAPILFCLNTEFTTNVIGPPRMAKGGTMAPGATWVRGAVLPKRLDNGRCFVFGGLGRFDTLSM
jgi:hypothetical protein